jgi:carbon-monoxide dehydrogenase medium subunit
VKPAPFEYTRPATLDEALATLARDDAKVLAGGQSLVPALNMRLLRPAVLVDVNGIGGLDSVETTDEAVVLGATVRQADPQVQSHPVLRAVLPHVGHTVTRNRGTICGSLAHADPAAELPVALVAAGGSVVAAAAGGRRAIAADKLFAGPYTTTLAPGELIVESTWPTLREDERFAFEELALRGGDYALCMAAARVRGEEVRVVVGGVTPMPTVLEVDPDYPGESAAEQVNPWGSIHATPAYLRQLVRVLVDRTVGRAREGAP